MELDNIRPIVSGLAGGIAVWVMYTYLINRDAIQKGDACVVQYGRGLKITVALLFLVIAFIDYAALHAREDQQHIAYSLAFVFTASLMYLAIEVAFIKITFDSDVIKLVSPWRKAREIPWKSIEDYRWAHLTQWHVFYTKSHEKIRISPYLNGANAFLDKAFSILKEKYPERFIPPSAE